MPIIAFHHRVPIFFNMPPIIARYLCFFFLMALAHVGLAQSEGRAPDIRDSLKTALEHAENDSAKFSLLTRLCETWEMRDQEVMYTYAQQVMDFANEKDNPEWQALGNYWVGMYHLHMGTLDSSLIFLRTSLEKLEQLSEPKNRERMANTNLRIGKVLNELGRHEEATTCFLEAARIREENGDTLGVAWAHMYLASGSLSSIGEHKKVIEYAHRAMEVFERYEDFRAATATYGTLAAAHTELEEFDQALAYYRMTQANFKVLKHPWFEAGTTANIGLLFKRMDKLDSAGVYFKRALKIARASKYPAGELNALNGVGSILVAQNQPRQALQYLQSALKMADSLGVIGEVENAHYQLSKAYKGLGNYKKAYEHYQIYADITDSLHHEEIDQTVLELEAKYKSQQLDQEIKLKEQELSLKDKDLQLLNQEMQISNQESQLAIFTRNAIIGGSVGVVLVLLLLYQLQRSKRYREKLRFEEELQVNEEEKETLRNDVRLKSQKLASFALQMTQKNEKLSQLNESLDKLKTNDPNPELNRYLDQLTKEIDQVRSVEKDWEEFRFFFEQVHPDFFTRLKSEFPQLSSNDLRISAFLRLNMTTKEMAHLLGLPPKSVEIARYRLRKKLGLAKGENLVDFMIRDHWGS